MHKRIYAAIAALTAFLAVGLGIALTSGANAAPSAAAVQSDYAHCTGTVAADGTVTCKLVSPVKLVTGTAPNAVTDVQAFAQLVGPAGALTNLPANARLTGTVVDDKGTPATTDDVVTATVWRWFGHQVVRDAGNGNSRLAVYSGPIDFFVKTVSGGSAYCTANACS